MAVKRALQTDAKLLLKMVSIDDTAIDWENSYQGEDELSVEEKKSLYMKERDLSRLVFLKPEKQEDHVDIWCFKHPYRADMGSVMRKIISAVAQQNIDAMRMIWDECYFGSQKGDVLSKVEVAEKHNGRLKDSFIQLLEDCDILAELAKGYLDVYRGKEEKIAASQTEKK